MNFRPQTTTSQRRAWRTLWHGGAYLLASAAIAASAGKPAGSESRFGSTLTATTEAWEPASPTDAPAWWNTRVELSVQDDLPAAGEDAALFARADWVNHRGGSSLDDAAGVFNPTSNIAAGRHFRLLNLYFRRSWQDGRVRGKIGQLAADDDFMLSDTAGLFLNSAFGSLPSQVATPLCATCGNAAAYPIFPFAAPGVWGEASLTRRWSIQSAVYVGSAGADEPSNHGFDWREPPDSGLVLFAESVWRRTTQDEAVWRLGTAIHAGTHDNFARLLDDSTADAVGTLWSVYAMCDYVLVRTGPGAPVLTGFARAGLSPQSDRAAVAFHADFGWRWMGPWPARQNDALGVALAHSRFGAPYGSVQGLRHGETIVEVTYSAPATPWLRLQADLQRVFVAAASARPATIVGARAVLAF